MPHGPQTPEEARRHAKALAEDRKKPAWRDAPMAATVMSVLKAIRETIPAEEVGGERPQVNSTDVAKKLGTNVNAVCSACDTLVKRELITVEDDSNPEHKFYWIELTDKGLAEDLTISAPPNTRVKLPAAQPGPRSGYIGKTIFKIVTGNPRREGTHGHKGFLLYEEAGITYEKFRNKGGRNNDLQWDLDHKFVELRDAAGGGKSEEAKGNLKKEATEEPTEPKAGDSGKGAKGGSKGKGKVGAAAKSAGAVSNGAGSPVSKGQARSGSKSGVASRGRQVLRKH